MDGLRRSTSPRMRRRDLLLGLGAGGAFLSPFVRASRARAQAGRPKAGNFVMFFTPNGFARSEFGSDGEDAAFKLRDGTRLAEPMKDHFSVVRGLSNKSQNSRPFHDQITRLLTTVPGPSVSRAEGPSIDQVIAKLGGARALNLKVYRSKTANIGTYENLSWLAAGVPAGNTNDPREVYRTVFGQFMPSGTGAEADALLAQEKSMLDFLNAELGTFRGRVPGAERARLDAHLEAVRQAEKKLSAMPAAVIGGGVACDVGKATRAGSAAPPADGGPGRYDIPAFSAHGDVQMELLVAALACGLRNAGTLMWQAGASGINPTGGQGKASDHHHVSHSEAPRSAWVAIDRWYSGRYAMFLERLQTAGILDHTMVVWGSEIAELHSHENQVFVVGGGRALGVQHRKTLSFNGRSLSDLWVTAQKAAGVPGDTFGAHSNGGIPGLWRPV